MIGHWRVLYRLDANRDVVATDDFAEWSAWMEDAIDERRVGFDEFANGYVSTVFLGLDLHVYPHGQPRCFETMAFRYRGVNELPEGIYQTRATTWAQAVEQHKDAVRSYRETFGASV